MNLLKNQEFSILRFFYQVHLLGGGDFFAVGCVDLTLAEKYNRSGLDNLP